jgi:hypothetical protein
VIQRVSATITPFGTTATTTHRPVPTHGYAATREEAIAAFAKKLARGMSKRKKSPTGQAVGLKL